MTHKEAIRRIFASANRGGEPSLPESGLPEPSVEDCLEVWSAALSRPPRLLVAQVTMLATLESLCNERAGRRWIEAIECLRADGRITPEEALGHINDVRLVMSEEEVA